MKSDQDRQPRSYLLRLWLEPREVSDEGQPIRGYVRDLGSGEEHYVTGIGAVTELLERAVERARRASGAQVRPAEGEPA